MAASGLAEVAEAAAMEMALIRKSPRVHLLQLNAIFSGAFDKDTTCSGSDIAKYLERLNGVLPAGAIEPYAKTTNLHGFNFGRESFSARLGRSPSTDSIVASNFGSDQGSVDSCHYSSNGSDSNSGSSPCSPQEPDRYSRAGTPQPMPPIPPSLRVEFDNKQCVFNNASRTSLDACEDSERQDSSETKLETASPSGDVKHFYLQSSSSVPNSNCVTSFQRTGSENDVSSSQQLDVKDTLDSYDKTGRHSEQQPLFQKETESRVQVSSSSSSSTTNHSNCSSSELQRCQWQQCHSSVEGNSELVEHIRTEHVQVQKNKENFVCLWEGCKVYNRASCSLSWLERHILSHGGNKPFKCIVDNCSQRFPTQAVLQRHVNSHFENSEGGKANKCRDDIFPKSFRKKKLLKYKKRSAHGRSEDFFDSNIMEQIRYKLIERHSCANILASSRCITFQSRIKAKRTEKSGKVNVLLEWIPENILPDCWVSENSIIKYKTVPISSLPPESTAILGSCHLNPSDTPRAKQRRK